MIAVKTCFSCTILSELLPIFHLKIISQLFKSKDKLHMRGHFVFLTASFLAWYFDLPLYFLVFSYKPPAIRRQSEFHDLRLTAMKRKSLRL